VYINRVELTNIRQFRHLDLSFRAESGSPLKWSLFLGDNATGKTTLLRSIAVGLCDESSAAGLVRELTGSLVRKGSTRDGVIRIELIDLRGKPWTLQTTLKPLKRTGDMVRQKIFRGTIDAIKKRRTKGKVDLDGFPWKALFVVGYGAGRSLQGGEEYETYRNVDAVYTLFRYDQALQSPELGWRRLLDAARKKAKGRNSERAAEQEDTRIKELLHDVLVLEKNEEIELTPTGIQVKGLGYSTPLSSHADGYKATTTWVIDLIAWRMLFNRGLMPDSMTGIVLLDEIEQHLHPRWQRYIISRLHQQFPKLQFIATTHSPLCTAGTADFTEEQCQLISLVRQRAIVEPERLALPRGLRADQILTSDAFELDDTRNPEIGEKVAQFRELFEKPRLNPTQRRRFNSLRRYIDERVPEAGQFEEERRLRDELRELLEQLESTNRRSAK
jgi:predicted ATP-binding protein involved in virulence